MRRGCCLTGALFPVLISCVKMEVCPKCSSKHPRTEVASSLTCPYTYPVIMGQLLTLFYLK